MEVRTTVDCLHCPAHNAQSTTRRTQACTAFPIAKRGTNATHRHWGTAQAHTVILWRVCGIPILPGHSLPQIVQQPGDHNEGNGSNLQMRQWRGAWLKGQALAPGKGKRTTQHIASGMQRTQAHCSDTNAKTQQNTHKHHRSGLCCADCCALLDARPPHKSPDGAGQGFGGWQSQGLQQGLSGWAGKSARRPFTQASAQCPTLSTAVIGTSMAKRGTA